MTQGLRTAPLVNRINPTYSGTAHLQAQITDDLSTLLFWALDEKSVPVLVAVDTRTSKALWTLPQVDVPGSSFVSAIVGPHPVSGYHRLTIVNKNQVSIYDM